MYVGQWYTEVATLHLKPGERVSELSFSQTQDTTWNIAHFQRENSGKVVGVKVTTTTASQDRGTPRIFELYLQDKQGLLTFSFRENAYEDLVSSHALFVSCVSDACWLALGERGDIRIDVGWCLRRVA